jgi:hypothetical protein
MKKTSLFKQHLLANSGTAAYIEVVTDAYAASPLALKAAPELAQPL